MLFSNCASQRSIFKLCRFHVVLAKRCRFRANGRPSVTVSCRFHTVPAPGECSLRQTVKINSPVFTRPLFFVIFTLLRPRIAFLKNSKLKIFLMKGDGGPSLDAHEITMQFAINAMPISNMTAVKNF